MQKEAAVASKPAHSLKNETSRRKTGNGKHDGAKVAAEVPASTEWDAFSPGSWQRTIDVRDFIQRNVAPYHGDEAFLAAPTARTKAVWAKLQPYFKQEIQKGVLDVDAKTPSTLTSHKPG